MSSQKGNVSRTRPQKHKNVTAFKNNLHDSSKKIKAINSLQFSNVCPKCRAILEWKVKFKKYKTLKAAKTCVKCNERTIKEAYHTLCEKCAHAVKLCPKCGKDKVESNNSVDGDGASIQTKFNELVLEKSRNVAENQTKSGENSSDESYDRESSSDYEHDSESLISSDCDNVAGGSANKNK